MAEEKPAEGAEGEKAAPKPKRNLPPGLLLAVANTLLVIAALGATVYTKMIYKKPTIDESVEMEKIKKEAVKKEEAEETQTEKPVLSFETQTINIKPTQGKPHFVTISYAVELRNEEAESAATQMKAALTDIVIKGLAKLEFTDLNTVQGKLLFKSQLIREFNEKLKEVSKIEACVNDLFFSNFVIQ